MKNIFIAVLVFGSMFSLQVPSANACSCLPPASPQESLQQAAAVFTGKVTTITNAGIFDSGSDPVEVTFDVSQIWKGAEGKTVKLTTPQSSASCGISFEENKEYIVYAYEDEDGLSANLCSRTILLASAQEDVQELGQGELPSNNNSDTVQTRQFVSPGYVVLAVGAIIMAIVVIRTYKK